MSEKFIHMSILGFPEVNDEFISSTVKYYSDIRQFFNVTHRFRSVVSFCNEIAKALNYTLAYNELNLQKNFTSQYPSILPFGRTSAEPSILDVWEYYKKCEDCNTSVPYYFQMDRVPVKFAYCAIPNEKSFGWLGFMFHVIRPFHWIVWFLLATAWFCVGGLKLAGNSSINGYCKLILGPEMAGRSRLLNRSFPHAFVMLGMVVIDTYYSGFLTTQLALPWSQRIISTFSDLRELNFTLVFRSSSHKDFFQKMASYQPNQDLRKLTQTAYVSWYHLREFTTRPRKAIMMSWANVIRELEEANELIKTKQTAGYLMKRCYAGDELWDIETHMFVIMPPSNEEVVDIFKKFFVTGIYYNWMKEYVGLSHSVRVQERSRIVGWSKTKRVTGDGFSPIDFNLRLLTMFNWWFIALAMCLCVFCLEYSI